MTQASGLESRSLYLRYRPRRFGDVVAQDAVIRTLRNAVARGTVAHAYLLCGPRGTGKTSIARILYRALNCLAPSDGEPCGECASCRAADAGSAVDLIEMDAASHGGIEDVREIRERVYFAPAEARTKVYIVDEAHQLTARAWDAFLKTLEEPPPRTVFVLATTESHRVPATIVSRCQRFDLRRIPQGRMQDHLGVVARLEGIELESGVAERLSRLARGSLRDGISMLEQVAAFGGTPVTMEGTRDVLGLVRGDALRSYLDALSLGDTPRALQLLEDVSSDGADLRQLLDEVVFYLRGVLLARSGASAALDAHFGAEERTWIEEMALRWAPGQIVSLLRAFGEIESRGRDEQFVLARTELVTAWSAGLVDGSESHEQQVRRAPNTFIAPVAVNESRGSPPLAPSAQAEVPSVWSPPEPLQVAVSPVEPSTPEPEPSDAFAAASPSTASGAAPLRPAPEGATVASPEPGPLSLAGVQAQWPILLDRFRGTLSARMRLREVGPIDLEGEVLTLGGPIDELDLQRLDDAQNRAAVEFLLKEGTGLDLKVRFRRSESGIGASSVKSDVIPDGMSLADLGSSLFGGDLILDEPGRE